MRTVRQATRRMAALCVLAALAAPATTRIAYAVNPDETLNDPALETRARIISQDLRCLVCQNQSIDDSNSSLARDLRLLVRDRLVQGDSNDEVVAYIADRYGSYVLLRPPMRADTIFLWFGPGFIFLAAVLTAAVFFFRRRPPPGIDGIDSRASSEDEED